MTESAWGRMTAAVREAQQVMSTADVYAGDIAKLLRGRLRQVDRYTLVELKRELTNFDAQRKVWKP